MTNFCSRNFRPAFHHCLLEHSDSPNQRNHRSPAPRSIGDLPELKHVTCSYRYHCGRLLPAFSRPAMAKRAYLLLCMLSRACQLMTLQYIVYRVDACSDSSGTYRQQQREARRGPGVHRPPAVVVMSMPHQPSDAICGLCSEKQSQKRTTILRDTRLGDAAKAKRLAQPRKVQHDFCSHTPAFLPVCLILLACHPRMKFVRGKMR